MLGGRRGKTPHFMLGKRVCGECPGEGTARAKAPRQEAQPGGSVAGGPREERRGRVGRRRRQSRRTDQGQSSAWTGRGLSKCAVV